jgi:ATP-dependent DNA helicase RecG
VTESRLPPRFGGGPYAELPPVPRLFFDPDSLARPLADLERVTPAVARKLSAFGLVSVGDLIDHFPRRYEDFRDRKQIRDLRVGEEATVRATVVRVSAERTARRRVDVVKALLRDDTGAIEAIWFNQRYLTKVLSEDMQLSVRGVFRLQGGRPSLVVKSHEILEEESGETVHTEGIVPVYPASEQVSARLLRSLLRAVRPAMKRLPDPLPGELRAREGLPSRADATLAVHLPADLEQAKAARARLVLEELLLMQVGLLLHKGAQQRRVGAPALPPPGELSRVFLDELPFELTSHQLGALDELEGDLTGTTPMRRLLQGDVGSGKTVVALYCLLRAVEAGLQGALMAPTETLAGQHAETAARLIGAAAPVELLTAALTARERRAALERIASGEAAIVIGTHALLQ